MEENSTELNPDTLECLNFISAFLAMEPTNCLIPIARECGKGLITNEVQNFIWEYCINKFMNEKNPPSDLYVKNFLKKVIIEVESNGCDVLDELYEQFSYYMTSLKDDRSEGTSSRVCKRISFLFPSAKKLVVPLLCSVNMLEGDTGCSVWPSSLFLSEFILSRPEIFAKKSCFEVGSGVGLVGISLAYVKASKVFLTDGDLLTLSNMKLNLELNGLNIGTGLSSEASQDPSLVECKYLPWESASEDELNGFKPDIVLGADVIYDPICLPHLIRVLSILLNPRKSDPYPSKDGRETSSPENVLTQYKEDEAYENPFVVCGRENSNCINLSKSDCNGSSHVSRNGSCEGKAGNSNKSGAEPVAYLATVIRNIDTFNCFLRLAEEARLSVVDVTDNSKPLDLLPYMRSYERSSIRLFCIMFLCAEKN